VLGEVVVAEVVEAEVAKEELAEEEVAPDVATLTVKFTAAPFVTFTELGALQLAPVGAPVQAKLKDPVNPVPPVACKLNCAVCPAVTVALVLPPMATWIITAGEAFPVSVRLCGEFAASSVTNNVVVRTPAACGENVIGIVQPAPAASVPTQFVLPIVKSLAFSPFTATLATCSGAFPVLLSVAFCGTPLVPCVIVPLGGKLPGEVRLATGAGVGPAIPVPASVTNCGLPGELSEIINVA
jgi:hypothetical protein